MDLNIINNECFTINKIVDDNNNISNDVKELVIYKDDFQKFFMLPIVLLYKAHRVKH